VPRVRSLVLAVSAIALAACASAPKASLTRQNPRSVIATRALPEPARQKPLTAHRFAEVRDVVGPYVGRDGAHSLAAWAEAEGDGRGLFAMAVVETGAPGRVVRVAKLSGELDLVLVRGLGEASTLAGKPRFAVVTTRRSQQKSFIDVTALREDGSALWGPAVVAERNQRVLWVGLVLAAQQPLLVWAEQASVAKPGEPASIYAQPVSPEGKQWEPVLLSARACAWQAATLGGRAALASVKAESNGCATGPVTLDLLDPSGKADKSVDLGGRAALDLDLVAARDGFLLAWSDHGQLEPRVVTAAIDAKGNVLHAPETAVAAAGEQALLALVAGSSKGTPAFLVWENSEERSDGRRVFQISALDAGGRATGTSSRLLYARADGGAPELAAYGGGLAALTLAPACTSESACDDVPPVPTFVALDGDLGVRTSEPILLDALGGRAADLGWGLTCASEHCFALAAPSRSPAALYTVSLPIRSTPYRAAAEQIAATEKPRVTQSDVLLRAPAPLAQIAVGELAGRSLVGYVTAFDPSTPWQKLSKPAEDGRLEPLRARIGMRAFAGDRNRAPLGDEQAISLRAHSLGGLSLLTDSSSNKDSLLLWTGLDKGEPQVFLTLLGADGKRGQQRMLTHKSGDTSDVAGLMIDPGFLVAWVDERSGDAEVYATRVGRGLDKAGPEQRITTSAGAASDLLLTRVASKPYAIWADARAAEQPGIADIYAAFLRPSDGARDGMEHRLSNTSQHSFSPQVATLEGTTVLAWLEEPSESSPGSVRVTTLAPSGDAAGSVSVIPLEAGTPRALGIACAETSCRLAVTVEAEGRAELQAFEWRPSSAGRPRRLWGFAAPTAAAVAPLVRGNLIYVADERDGRGLVRRLAVDW